MQNKALVVIDLQNDITKNYKEIINNVNKAIEWATENNVRVVYIRHENLSAGKYKGSVLTCEEFADFVKRNEIGEFVITGADAAACVKSSCYNLCKENYGVTVLSDCVTSYDKKKIPEMLRYYESKGCKVIALQELLNM